MKKKIVIPVIVAVIIAAVLVAFPSTVFSPEYKQADPPATEPVEETKQPAFDKAKYSLTDPESQWVIVSKVSPLEPIDYAPTDLIDVEGQLLRASVAKAFTGMQADARQAGYGIIPLSAYRSYQTQQTVYANEVATYGQATADTQSARPGYSEHQTGLVVDIGGGGCGIEDCFGQTAEYQWLKKNAHTYGFIQRYPTDKQAVTGYRAEPWHWRYVGKELATEMHEQKVETLEEFFDVVPTAQPW